MATLTTGREQPQNFSYTESQNMTLMDYFNKIQINYFVIHFVMFGYQLQSQISGRNTIHTILR